MGQLWSLLNSSHHFNFLELPVVVKRQVLKCLKLRDLFVFSQVSQKSYDLVRDAVVKVKCGIRLEKNNVQLILQYNEDDDLIFVLGKHGYYQLVGSIVHGEATLNGEHFDYHFDSEWPNYIYTREQDDTDAINTIFRYFSGLFHFSPSPSNYSTVFLNPNFLEYCESVELFEDYMFRIGNPKIELLRIQGAQSALLRGPELIRFIDNVNCTDMIKIDVPFRGSLNYHKINVLNTIQLCNGEVEESDFLNFQIKNIHLENICFSEKILVEFVRKWLRKESKIESLILKLDENNVWKSEEKVFGWLGATKWHPRTRGRYYRWKAPGVFDIGDNSGCIKEWDCSKGLDILRSDGLLATVHLTYDTFTFFVWNQRFH